MDWQQKFAAIQAFVGQFDASLRMRKPGDWYVDAGMGLGGDGVIRGVYGNGATPEGAVNDHWRQYVEEIPVDSYIVASRPNESRRGRWNGFMWELLTEEEAQRWVEDRRKRAKAHVEAANA